MMSRSFKEWFDMAEEKGISLAEVIVQNEVLISGKSPEQTYAELALRWNVMKKSANKALNQPQGKKYKPGELFTHDGTVSLISGQASLQRQYAEKGGYCGAVINRVMALALSCSEVNAGMGKICAAPTAGACGVLPAVMIAVAEHLKADEKLILDGLLVAGGVGGIITRNATVSGAKGGCQAECGSAAAMACAAAVIMAGGNMAQLANGVSICLMNCMGLVCDPVAGLVQLPCSYRNASQAINALISADMALAGQDSVIPPDETVEAMYRVGRMLPTELRETALGGVAQSPTAKAIEKEFSAG